MRLCDENETFTRTLKTHLFVIFENEFTLAIWFEEPLWSAVECYRHGLWRYVNLVNLNLNLHYRRIYASLGINELRPRKIMNWQSPGDFLNKLVFQLFNLQGKYYVLGLFCRKPWNLFTELISVFRNRDTTNILIDYPIHWGHHMRVAAVTLDNMTEDNRAPLLCYFNLFASFRSQ